MSNENQTICFVQCEMLRFHVRSTGTTYLYKNCMLKITTGLWYVLDNGQGNKVLNVLLIKDITQIQVLTIKTE